MSKILTRITLYFQDLRRTFNPQFFQQTYQIGITEMLSSFHNNRLLNIYFDRVAEKVDQFFAFFRVRII